MRRSRIAASTLLAFAFIALVTAAAGATTLVREGLEQLTSGNDLVLVGKVTDIHSYWNADHSFIFTDVRVEPTEMLKGGKARGIVFTLMGGTVGEITTLVIGGPDLVPGSEYVLFLSPTRLPGGREAISIRSLSQGAFEVVSQQGGGRRALSQAIGEPLLPDALGRSVPVGGDEGLELTEMLSQIRDLVRNR